MKGLATYIKLRRVHEGSTKLGRFSTTDREPKESEIPGDQTFGPGFQKNLS